MRLCDVGACPGHQPPRSASKRTEHLHYGRPISRLLGNQQVEWGPGGPRREANAQAPAIAE